MTLEFPLAHPCRWTNADAVAVPASAKPWLLEEGSLTQKLKKHSNQFSVKLIGQQPATVFDSEFELFQQHHVDTPFAATVREVMLYCDHQPWVFARSIFPLSALTDENLNLSAMGSRSLGQSLFDQADLLRSPFQLTQLEKHHPIAKLNTALHHKQTELWGRRSLFFTSGQRVLVSEFFLSPLPFYAEC
ncbi:chorismate lyase [Idiomarina seosinensis]|uniref:chorismate--pyruvate lyase family protein n=1 Tax=Idiomarina seosinensis TaxID=281739 RepID=UPI003851575F